MKNICMRLCLRLFFFILLVVTPGSIDDLRRAISDRELASYLMYPKVFLDYAEHHRVHGDVSVLPTEAFFYGMRRDDELFVDIERGKTLVIRFLAVGDADQEGRRTIFFELNGQPREVKVADRSLAPSGAAKRIADDGDPAHVPAPMPGRDSNQDEQTADCPGSNGRFRGAPQGRPLQKHRPRHPERQAADAQEEDARELRPRNTRGRLFRKEQYASRHGDAHAGNSKPGGCLGQEKPPEQQRQNRPERIQRTENGEIG